MGIHHRNCSTQKETEVLLMSVYFVSVHSRKHELLNFDQRKDPGKMQSTVRQTSNRLRFYNCTETLNI